MRELVEPHRERIYPPLDTLRLSWVKFYRLTAPARMWWAAACPSASHKANP